MEPALLTTTALVILLAGVIAFPSIAIRRRRNNPGTAAVFVGMYWRVATAFLAAPVVVSLGMVLTNWPRYESPESEVRLVLSFVYVYYVYSLAMTLIFALPLYLLLNHFGLINRWVCLGAGLLIGCSGAVVLLDRAGLWTFGSAVIVSGLAGLLFWRVVSEYHAARATC
jgi:hypothetical protein